MDTVKQALLSFAGEDRVLFDQPMDRYTTFRVGGPADIVFLPKSSEELVIGAALAREKGLNVEIIGGGSNLLVSDEGVRGMVIVLGKPFSEITVEGNILRAQAGARMSAVAAAAQRAGLSGLEFASGIPGTVGGGVFMNAGAYGGQVSDVLVECGVIREGRETAVPASEMELSYRHSAAMENGDIVTYAVFELKNDDPDAIRARMDDMNGRRRDKQPLEYPSAGSAFKRPEGYFAGALIEQAGLKGYTIGGAQVSEKHAGFIINVGGATQKDICDLIDHIRESVHKNSGVWLEPEIRMLG